MNIICVVSHLPLASVLTRGLPHKSAISSAHDTLSKTAGLCTCNIYPVSLPTLQRSGTVFIHYLMENVCHPATYIYRKWAVISSNYSMTKELLLAVVVVCAVCLVHIMPAAIWCFSWATLHLYTWAHSTTCCATRYWHYYWINGY